MDDEVAHHHGCSRQEIPSLGNGATICCQEMPGHNPAHSHCISHLRDRYATPGLNNQQMSSVTVRSDVARAYRAVVLSPVSVANDPHACCIINKDSLKSGNNETATTHVPCVQTMIDMQKV